MNTSSRASPISASSLSSSLPAWPDERQAEPVLVGPRGFAHEHQVGVGVTGAEDDGRPRLVQGAAHTPARLLVDLLEELPAFGGAHHREDRKQAV